MNACIRFHTASGIVEQPFEAPMGVGTLLGFGGHAVDMPCGKQGKCGKCRVRITGALSEPDDTERRALSGDEISSGIRLACRAVAKGDVEIWPEAEKKEAILTDFTLPPLPASSGMEGVGLAVDIGTTTLAAYLCDLSTWVLLSVQSMPNPQRAFGADVTSRIKASLEGQGEALQACITGAIRSLAVGALHAADRSEEELCQAVLTGNTAMLYLLTGQEPGSIAFVPFEPVTKMGIAVPGDAVGLFGHTRVWLPDCIAAYVGADITCAMLYAATRPEFACKPVLLADIGTNGEMALFTEGRVLTCSTAAGPAFEGAGIRCGMTAQNGAISRVDAVNGRLVFSVIGGGHATGVCGSGLVDAVAALLALEVIDETGRMEMEDHPLDDCMVTVDDQPAFRFPGTEVVITQADVRAVQLAKASICAGMLTLLDEAGLDCEDVQAFQIAGGFGNCIRTASAAAIGLIPAEFARRTHPLGNASGAGAAMMLLDEALRAEGAALSRSCEVIELSTSPAFSDHFIECMMIERCEA